jgi:hypothetical protein
MRVERVMPDRTEGIMVTSKGLRPKPERVHHACKHSALRGRTGTEEYQR